MSLRTGSPPSRRPIPPIGLSICVAQYALQIACPNSTRSQVLCCWRLVQVTCSLRSRASIPQKQLPFSLRLARRTILRMTLRFCWLQSANSGCWANCSIGKRCTMARLSAEFRFRRIRSITSATGSKAVNQSRRPLPVLLLPFPRRNQLSVFIVPLGGRSK